MTRARLQIWQLRLGAPVGRDGSDFARQTAAALDTELRQNPKSGRISSLRVSPTIEETRDPGLLAKAIRRAMDDGGRS